MPPARILLVVLSFGGIALLLRTLLVEPLPEWISAAGLTLYLLLAIAGWVFPQLEMYGDVFSRGPKDKRLVALTFDGGPDPKYTAQVLDLLAERQVKATFFVMGERAEEQEGILESIHAGGHELGLGGYRPDRYYAWKSPKLVVEDIERVQKLIVAATGERAQVLRSPSGGRVGARTFAAAKKAGVTLVAWSVSAAVEGPSSSLLARVEAKLGPGAVIRLEDGTSAKGRTLVTLELLPKLLDAIEEQKLEPVHVSTLIDS